jgi:hypothetical protein
MIWGSQMRITSNYRTHFAALAGVLAAAVVSGGVLMALPASAGVGPAGPPGAGNGIVQQPPAVQAPAGATKLCGNREWERVSGGQEILYDDVFDASRTRLCISDRDHGSGFVISSSRTPRFAWQAYPNLFTGCWYTVCSAGPLPAEVSRIRSASLTLYTRYPAGSGSDATDFWFNKTRPGDQRRHPNGLELMLWGAWRGVPTGGVVAYPVIDHLRWMVESWRAGQGGVHWRYVQMRRLGYHRWPSVSDLDLLPILHFCEARGWLMPWWWAASMHAGFEVVRGGRGDRILRYSLPVVLTRAG